MLCVRVRARLRFAAAARMRMRELFGDGPNLNPDVLDSFVWQESDQP
jgi:hypothetical protein